MEAQVTQPAARRADVDFLARKSVRHRLWITGVGVVIGLGGLMLLFPVYFMFITSLKAAGSAFIMPLKWLPYIEYQPAWENYKEAHEFMKWTVVYRNTLIVSLSAAIGDTLSALLVAYGFARFRAPYKNLLFTCMLATLMVPFAVRLVPEYLGFARLGMVNTFWPLILPGWLGSAFYIFLLRQFFTTIPMAMDEAATIDGAGPIRILFQVLAPQIRPALIVVMISAFTFNWNDFLRPLIYLNSADSRTAAIALSYFSAMYGGTPFHLMMAAALVMLIPVLVLFFALQRYYIQGVVISGVKG
ncbi:MAG TPA: carbohydrate ABC transporter permease [Chloroflexota bacterium]|jgi:multiple sugar transport system permease protein|nr:carbohydrate ABC transporter permease [Chloroflexota bacterium]